VFQLGFVFPLNIVEFRPLLGAPSEAEVSVRSPRDDYDIETSSDIDALRSRWQAIEASGASTPFQSFDWVSALLKTIGRSQGAEPHIIIVKDRRSGEDLMLLPLVRRRAGLLRFIEIPDFRISDYIAPILSRMIASDPQRTAAIWEAALAALPRGDLLYLQKIPQILSDTPNPLVGLKGFRTETYSSWQLALPDSMSELEQKTLSSGTRRQIRRRTRQLEELGDLRYVAPTSASERKAVFDVLREQRQARFVALGRNNILASPKHNEFYDLMLAGALDPDVLTVHALKVDDEIIATAFGLYWQKRFYLLMSSMASGKWLERSPGVVMIWKLIDHMHARGCRTFDFTIGDEAYKRQFGAIECTLSDYFEARSPVGAPYALGLKLWPSLVAMKRKLAKAVEGWRAAPAKEPADAKTET
jgi:CelD/BcsL family acetyltransferase involved in cellulose biosynthesis